MWLFGCVAGVCGWREAKLKVKKPVWKGDESNETPAQRQHDQASHMVPCAPREAGRTGGGVEEDIDWENRSRTPHSLRTVTWRWPTGSWVHNLELRAEMGLKIPDLTVFMQMPVGLHAVGDGVIRRKGMDRFFQGQ